MSDVLCPPAPSDSVTIDLFDPNLAEMVEEFVRSGPPSPLPSSPDPTDPYRESINRALEDGWSVLRSAADGVQEPDVVWNYRNVRNAHRESLRKVDDLFRQVSRVKGDYWRGVSSGEENTRMKDQLDGLEKELQRAIDHTRSLKDILDRLRPSYHSAIRESVESARLSLLRKTREKRKRAEEALAVCREVESYFEEGWDVGLVDLDRLELAPSEPSISPNPSDPSI